VVKKSLTRAPTSSSVTGSVLIAGAVSSPQTNKSSQTSDFCPEIAPSSDHHKRLRKRETGAIAIYRDPADMLANYDRLLA
jgi:hypothetical protein